MRGQDAGIKLGEVTREGNNGQMSQLGPTATRTAFVGKSFSSPEPKAAK